MGWGEEVKAEEVIGREGAVSGGSRTCERLVAEKM